AEDGIRDFHVTGVQTCALPICPWASWDRGFSTARRARKRPAKKGFSPERACAARLFSPRSDTGKPRAAGTITPFVPLCGLWKSVIHLPAVIHRPSTGDPQTCPQSPEEQNCRNVDGI